MREAKKAQTRLAVRDAAVELFVTNGYDATTVAEIAAAAQVSEPTFFRYYPLRETRTLRSAMLDLFDAATERLSTDFAEPPAELVGLGSGVEWGWRRLHRRS